MLDVEIMKKGCSFADGFSFDLRKDNRPSIDFPDGQWTFLDYTSELFQLITYPLFLQRVIEGINISETNVNFDISYCDNEYKVEVYGLDSELKEYKIFCAVDCGGIDQAKEKAIKYILGFL